MDEDRAAEASAGPPTITLSQARKMSREILNFVLENSATSHGGSAKAYDLVTLLERMTVSTGHVQPGHQGYVSKDVINFLQSP